MHAQSYYDGLNCKKAKSLTTKLNLVTLAVLMVAGGLLGMHAAKMPWTAWRIAGMAIALPAWLLFVSAHIELGGDDVSHNERLLAHPPSDSFLRSGDDSGSHHLDWKAVAAHLFRGSHSAAGGA